MPALDGDGEPIPGATMHIYLNRTDQLASLYSGENLVTPVPNPVVANASGRFPAVYVEAGTDLARVLYSVVFEAPYGPPGQPFTYDDVDFLQIEVTIIEDGDGNGGGTDDFDHTTLALRDGSNIDAQAFLENLGIVDEDTPIDLAPVYAAIALKQDIATLPKKPVALDVSMTSTQVRTAVQAAIDANAGKYATFIPPHPTDKLWLIDQAIRVPDNTQLIGAGRRASGLKLSLLAGSNQSVVTNSLNDGTDRVTPNRNILIKDIELHGFVDRLATTTSKAVTPGTLGAGSIFTTTVSVPGLTTSSKAYVDYSVPLPRGARVRWSKAAGTMTVYIDNTSNIEPATIPAGNVQVKVYTYDTGASAALWFAGVWDSIIDNVYAHDSSLHALAIDGGANTQLSAASIRAGAYKYAKCLSKNVIVQNSEFSKGFDDNVTTHNVDGVWFINCDSHDSYADGNSNGYEIDDWSTNVFLIGCRSNNVNSGLEIKAHNHSQAPRGVYVSDFLSENAWNFGVDCYHSGNSAPVSGDPPYTPPSKSARFITLSNIRVYNAGTHAMALTDYTGVVANNIILQAGPQSFGHPSEYKAALQIKTLHHSVVSNVFIDGFSNYNAAVHLLGSAQENVALTQVTAFKSGMNYGFFMDAAQSGVSLSSCAAYAPDSLGVNSCAFGVASDSLANDVAIFDCRQVGYARAAAVSGVDYIGKVPDVTGGMIYNQDGPLDIRRSTNGYVHRYVTGAVSRGGVYADTSAIRIVGFNGNGITFGYADNLNDNTVGNWWAINSQGVLYPVDDHYNIGGTTGYVGRTWTANMNIRNNPSSEGAPFGATPVAAPDFFQVYGLDGALKVRLPDGTTGTINITPDP